MHIAQRWSYLLKSGFLKCLTAVVSPLEALGEADTCEMRCRDQIEPCRNAAYKQYSLQPPAGVWFKSSDSFSCQEPHDDALQRTDEHLIISFSHKHQLRALLSLDVTLDLNRLHCRWGDTVTVGVKNLITKTCFIYSLSRLLWSFIIIRSTGACEDASYGWLTGHQTSTLKGASRKIPKNIFSPTFLLLSRHAGSFVWVTIIGCPLKFRQILSGLKRNQHWQFDEKNPVK